MEGFDQRGVEWSVTVWSIMMWAAEKLTLRGVTNGIGLDLSLVWCGSRTNQGEAGGHVRP